MNPRAPRAQPVRVALAALSVMAAMLAAGWILLSSPFGRAMFSIAAAWAAATALLFPSFLAVSIDDLADVMCAALRGAAAAMWYPAALLLLQESQPWQQAAALAMVGAATSILAAQQAPRRHRDRVRRAPVPGMFGTPVDSGFLSGPVFAVTAGALALQAAAWCCYSGYLLASAGLTAFAALVWTRNWIWRGAAGPPGNPGSPWRVGAAIALTLLLVLPLTHVLLIQETPPQNPLRGGSGSPIFTMVRDSKLMLGRLTRRPPPSERQKTSTRLVFSPKALVEVEGMPGLILRPFGWTGAASVPSPIAVAGAAYPGLAAPLSFPFTGEYYLYRTASGRLPESAPVERGSPMEAVYGSTLGIGTMETEAHQPLSPPLDFSHCGEVRMTLRSKEVMGAEAVLWLVTQRGEESLGKQLFGIESLVEETLVYRVPPSAARAPVKELKVSFNNTASQGAKSTQVAVLSFSLTPR